MSVTDVQLDWRSRTAEVSEEGDRSYSWDWLVTTNNANDGPKIAMTATGVPRRGALYIVGNDIDLNATCRTVSAKPESEARTFWRVTASFSSRPFDPQQDPDKPENPLQRPAVITWDGSLTTKVVIKDIQGKLIASTAQEKFDPAPEVDERLQSVVVTKNLADFDHEQAFDFVNTVNDSEWLGGAAGTWKCQRMSANLQHENDYTFWTVTGEFHYKKDGWQLELLDQGFWKINALGRRELIKDDLGMPVTSPAPLDGQGGQLPEGGVPKFLKFNVYREKDFDQLGLT